MGDCGTMVAGTIVESGSQATELFLLRLRYKEGRLLQAKANTPILLNDPQTVWIAYRGRIDVFLAPATGDTVTGIRRHLLRAETGQAVFGVSADDAHGDRVLLAVGGPDTQLLRITRTTLQTLSRESEYADQVVALLDRWITELSESISEQGPPQGARVLETGDEIHLEPLGAAHANRDILWVKVLAGHADFMGNEALPMTPATFLPLSNHTWLRPHGPTTLQAVRTRVVVEQDDIWAALDHFHQVALACIRSAKQQIEQAEHTQWKHRTAANEKQVADALTQLAAVLDPKVNTRWSSEDLGIDPLLSACRLVGEAMDLAIQSPPQGPSRSVGRDPLLSIAHASRVRVRRVALEGTWFREDHGPLLGYLAPSTFPGPGESPSLEQARDAHPVALVPVSGRKGRGSGRYEMLDPVTHTRIPVTKATAAALLPSAHIFYRPLPHRAVTGMDLLRLGLRDSRRDLMTLGLVGLAMGLLGLVTPLIVAALFDTVIPGVQKHLLMQLGLVLLVSALATAMFQLTRNLAVLRLTNKLDVSIQAAIWDRLLRLPASFFRQYTAGNLAERVLGISVMRQFVSETIVFSLLTGLFSIVNVVLLFYYAPGLAWYAIALAALAMAVTAIVGATSLRHQRALNDIQGQVAGLVLQLVTGIAKLRTAGVEARAFARWAAAFSRQREIALKSRTVASGLHVFHAAYPVLTLLAIFALFAFADGSRARLSTGAFLAFNTAFAQLMAAGLASSSSWINALSAVPLYERAKPILQALPEANQTKADPGTLTGRVEASHVAFRYRESEPLVLNDVSLQISPGEFVAIVGPSGSGKSTLLRLLLRFDMPCSGAIYYDGQDLDRVDIEAVRRQIGVVLQDSRLVSGSILSNIIGSSLLTADDAWEAAHSAGLARDIEEMPMGMHTVLNAGGSNLSGGQRQRILIARAMVHKPRLLFLDEATSALDNPNQALISASLEKLSATRIVIAHRLSTIINADRIYVMEEGRIVQSGTYAALMGQRGPFVDLARRQLL
jgi:NHLM bacteriocin system ABC transporter ATP-binding protein